MAGGRWRRWWRMVVVVVVDEGRERCAVVLCVSVRRDQVFVEVKKPNSLLIADCRPLVHLLSCRCLQLWSADCRHFTSSKTNSTLQYQKVIYCEYKYVFNEFYTATWKHNKNEYGTGNNVAWS
ncbi:hypothetical protein Hanom_Chr16g01520121 [Helianthus anomalus]